MVRIITQYKWIKVIRKKFKPGKPNVNWSYSKTRNAIILYNNFFKLDTIRQNSILEHEYWHYIWHKMPVLYRKIWEWISNWKLIKVLNVMWYTKHNKNDYVTDYAQTKITEDWSECIETEYLLRNDPKYKWKSFESFADDKMRIAKSMYDYFSKKELWQ